MCFLCSCIEYRKKIDSQNNSSSAKTSGSDNSKSSPQKFFMEPRHFYLLSRQEVDLREVAAEYPDLTAIEITSLGGGSRYDVEYLEDNSFIVEDFAPRANGKYLVRVEIVKNNNLSVHQFELEN